MNAKGGYVVSQRLIYGHFDVFVKCIFRVPAELYVTENTWQQGPRSTRHFMFDVGEEGPEGGAVLKGPRGMPRDRRQTRPEGRGAFNRYLRG